jgi:nucleoside-diphosphate-sugar epimerase
LARRGWRVRALVRPSDGIARRIPAEWETVAGDAMDAEAVRRAADGAALIVHAVNPPSYRNWAGQVLPMIDNTIAAARAGGARVLLPGTIYNYGPDAFPLLHEDSPQHPVTGKGAIRVELERRLEAAAADGVRSLILRCGDFFGPRPGNNWFSQGLVKPGRPVRAYPGRPGVGHAWAYLPDVGEAFAELAESEAELAPFARFHFAGHWDRDGRAMTAAIARAVGDPALKAKPLPWPLLRLVAPFRETVRELLEMQLFWRVPVRLDNAVLVARLGREPHTPLDAAVHATLKGLGIPVAPLNGSRLQAEAVPATNLRRMP